MYCNAETLLPDPRPSLRLTIRPFSHSFTASDFEAYEYSRHYLFRDPRIARAALLAGGILWRLAIEDCLPDVVLDGPQPGIGFQLRDRTGSAYIDDGLAEEEIQHIVGMYFAKPEDRAKGENDTFPMWWPLPKYFKESSLNFPAWTPVAENWYTKLRAKYRQGSEQPKQGPKWRDAVKNWDKRARLVTEESRERTGTLLRRILLN